MTKLEQAAKIALNVLENKCDPKDEVLIALREALAEPQPHYSNTDNPVDFPKLGCVNHDCDKCQAKKALAEPAVPVGSLRDKVYPMAQHQEELNKFAEDSVWDGEGP